MTEEQREAAFQRNVDLTVNYFAAIEAAGDLAWFEVGHDRRAEVVEKLGLAQDIDETELRRAFFMRRYTRGTNA